MKFLSTSLLPRVLFLVTLFGVSSGAAYLWIQSTPSRQSSQMSKSFTASPSPERLGSDEVAETSEVFLGGESGAEEISTPNPSPDLTPATEIPTQSFFSQLVSGINSVAQMVVSGRSSLTYQGGTASPGTINANQLEGSSWENPAPIGGGTPSTAVFTDVTTNGTLTATGPVTMSQFANGFLLANGIGEVTASRVSLSNSSQVADRLPTASGGTGNDFSGTAAGSVLSFGATGQMTAVAPGTSGYVLTSNGAGALPTWQAGGAASVDWTAPGTIGSATPNTGRFTSINTTGSSYPLNVGSSSQLKVDDNGRMTITYVGDSGSLSSSGGAIFLNQTSNIGTGIGIYSNAGAEALGNMINVKVDNPNYSQAAFYMNYDGNSNAVEIVSNANDESSNALSVTGNNIQDSTLGVIGYELSRGTIKVSHYRPGTGTDSSASGLSIDLKGVGTRAQGIYVDSTETGGTLGNLLRLRNESIDKFVVNYQGNLALAGNITQGAAGTDTTYTKQGNNSNDQFFVGTNGAFRVQRSATDSEAFRVQIAGDTQGRWLGTSDGKLKWGPGNATQDTVLQRTGAGALSLTGSLAISGTTTLNNLAYTWPGSIGGNGYILSSTTGGTLTWIDPTTVGNTYWQRNSGVLTPTTTSDTLSLGTTSSLGTAALYISKGSGTNALAVFNQTGSADILTASSSGTTVFTIANNGNTNVGGTLTSTGNFLASANITQGANGTDTTFTKNGNVSGDQFVLGTNGAFRVQRSSSGSEAFRMQVSGDTQGRWLGTSDGQLKWGPGNVTQDTVLRRNSAGVLALEGSILINNLNQSLDTVIKGNSDSNLFYVDATGNRVGIGLSTPLAALHIHKNAGTLPGLLVNQTGTGDIFTASASGTTKFTILNSGNVGIGTTSPTSALEIGSGVITIPAGTISNPSIAFTGNTNTGIYRFGVNTLGFATGGSTHSLGSTGILTLGATWSGSGGGVQIKSGSGGAGNANRQGQNLTLSGGESTGNGVGSNLIFRTSPTGDVSGSSENALVERMRINQDGNVGIGTTTPTAPLHVNGAYGSNAAVIINQLNNGDILVASSSGTTRFTISNAGNVTVGANGSDTTFTKNGNTAGDQFFIGTTGAFRAQRSGSNSEAFGLQVNGDTQRRLLGTSDGRLKWGPGNATQDIELMRGAANQLYLNGAIIVNNSNASANTVIKGNADSNLLYVDATGNRIGIGTSTPVAGLHISKDGGTLPAFMVNQVSSNGSTDIMTASSSGTTRMVMKNDGSIGLGTGSPGYKIDVLETGNLLNGFRAQNSNSGNLAAAAIGFSANSHSAAFVAFGSGYTGGGLLTHFAGRSALLTDVQNPGDGLDFVSAKASGDQRWYTGGFGTGNERMRLNSSGGLAIGGTDPGANKLKVFGDFEVTGACTGCSSDERLKKNILQLDGSSLEKLLSIKGVSYEWSDSSKAHDYPGLQIGVVAQDVERVFPELVGTDARGFKYVRYDKLIAPTIEAIREQQGQLSSIDSRVTGLDSGLAHNLSTLLSWVDSKWNVIADVAFNKTVSFKDKVTFAAATIFSGKTQFEKPIAQSKDAAGSVVLASGQQSVTVVFSSAYDNAPFVTLTPVGKGVTGYYVDEVSTTGFKLKVDQALSQDVLFNWVATQTTTGAVLGITAASPSPTPAASPQSSPPVSATPEATPSATPVVSPSPALTPYPEPSLEPSPTPLSSPQASPASQP